MRTLLFFVIIILSSCNPKYPSPILGNWVGYQEIVMLDNDSVVYNYNNILAIDKDSIRTINFKFISDGSRDSLWIFSYKLIGNKIICLSEDGLQDTLVIEVLNNNTMILSRSNYKYKYSRLKETKDKTQKPDLAGKSFTISDSIYIIDTVEFLDNNSVILRNYFSDAIFINEWRLREFNGSFFLVLDYVDFPSFIIKQRQINDFELKINSTDNFRWRLKKIEEFDKLKHHNITGKWKGIRLIPNYEIEIEFEKDSAYFNHKNHERVLKYSYIQNLNRDLLFLWDSINHIQKSYRIKKINQDSLFLIRISPVYDPILLRRMK